MIEVGHHAGRDDFQRKLNTASFKASELMT